MKKCKFNFKKKILLFTLILFNKNLDETNIYPTEYEVKFISMIKSNNILATQFHPEKSHSQGIQLKKFFCDEF